MKFHQRNFHVGEQAGRAPAPEQFGPEPFRKSRPPAPLRFEVDLVAEAPARIHALPEEAEGACMAHHALRNPVPWSTRLVHDGVEIDARDSGD